MTLDRPPQAARKMTTDRSLQAARKTTTDRPPQAARIQSRRYDCGAREYRRICDKR